MSLRKFLFCFALFLSVLRPVKAQELHIAAAADLNFALPEVAKAFEAQSGIKVVVSFGSSGNLFAQIQSGAPFDVFCSADMEYPLKLAFAGLALPRSAQQYASGRLVLWVRNDSKLNFERDSIKALLDPGIKKIAIANPEHAPYGRAAVAALQKSKLYDQVKEKLVLGENVSQTAQFVTSGNADVGLISLSLAQAPELQKQGRFWKIPSDIAQSLPQGVIVLKQSASPEMANRFVDFFACGAGQQILARYGFEISKGCGE